MAASADNRRRVVITGLGCVTPVGSGKDAFFEALIKGRSGIDRITLFDPEGYPSQIAGEVKGFDPTLYLDTKEARHQDRFTQFAVAAAKEAVDGSGLVIEPIAERVGVIIGSGIGGLRTLEDQNKILLERGPRRVSPFLVPMMIADMAAGQVSIYFGAKGPNYCATSACSSANHAIGEAAEAIRRGAADACIAGGAEAPITPLALAGFGSARALSTRNDDPQKASRPFDADRDGFVIAEGAGMVILEEAERALARGAHIYAELAGYGATADAFHITAPEEHGAGATASMQVALADAGLGPADVDYINAHGTSTGANDRLETLAVKNVFGDRAYEVLMSSTKSMTGHALGAAGAIELIACVVAMRTGTVPPTINLEHPDPECDLNYVPNTAVTAEVNVALSNSFGFGGHNATLVIKRFEA